MAGRSLAAGALAVFMLLLCGLAVAQTNGALEAVSGSVRYEATTGSSSWSGVAPLEVDGLSWSGDPDAAVRGALAVALNAFDSGNRFRDENARLTVFESDAHPEARFRVRAFERIDGETDGGTDGLPEGRSAWQASGDLTLHGVTHEVSVPVTVMRAGTRVTAEASWTVSLAAFGMQAPTFLWLQVEDAVDVSVTLDAGWQPGRP